VIRRKNSVKELKDKGTKGKGQHYSFIANRSLSDEVLRGRGNGALEEGGERRTILDSPH